MTATNHVLAGALVAAYIQKPGLAIPLAFITHFFMDAIPHFGVHIGDEIKRNGSKIWRLVLLSDLLIAALLVVTVPAFFEDSLYWLIFFSMLACASPDIVWGWRLIHELRHKTILPRNLFSRFHTRIQWSETKAGLAVEFIISLALFSLIIIKSLQ